ncbi:MAG: hypothetical protein QNJ51_26945 [Calothrix sp. MO_167.B12]|nr:hypothetical protein [Calothrix sp. MO_167.B12]
MNNLASNNRHNHECCFCRYFQLEGYQWGYCELLSARVKRNLDACHAYIPPFTSSTDHKNVSEEKYLN